MDRAIETVGESSEQLFVNGEARPLEAQTTVADLLEALDLHPQAVAVELNRTILPRERYTTTELASNDRIEIVRFVQGG